MPGQDPARHPHVIATRPASHQQGRDQIAGQVRTPLACERLAVALFVAGRAGGDNIGSSTELSSPFCRGAPNRSQKLRDPSPISRTQIRCSSLADEP